MYTACNTAYTVHIHCIYTACTLHVTTAYTLHIHCIYTAYTLHVTLHIHYIYTASTLHIHCVHTAYTLRIHCTYMHHICAVHTASLGPMADDRLYSDRGGDHLPKMSFVEVADTRVSRLHCVIKLAAPTDCAQALQAVLEDHSSNGTYVDDVKVKSGESVPLSSGCKVSLVRSVTPWVERCFTFWEGMPTSGSIATACLESVSSLQLYNK